MTRLAKPIWWLTYIGCQALFIFAQSDNSTLSITDDGSCGVASDKTCLDSSYGSCCSIRGFCGATNDFCNPTAGCQPAYGSCSTNTSYISYDGKCGSTDPNNQVCIGSSYGSCCSQKGWCGSTADYCGTGCQSAFGTCGGANTTVDVGSDGESASSSNTASMSAPSSSQDLATTSVSASDNGTPSGISQPSLLSLEIIIGVLSALLLVSIFSVCIWKYRRSARHRHNASPEHTTEEIGKCSCGRLSIYEIPQSQRNRMSGFLSNILSQRQQPVELASPGHDRAELRGA